MGTLFGTAASRLQRGAPFAAALAVLLLAGCGSSSTTAPTTTTGTHDLEAGLFCALG